MAQTVKNLPEMQETQVWYLDLKDPLEEGMATYSSILAWRTLWTEEFSRFSSFQFSLSVVSNSLRPHELQHTRPPCPSPTPRVHPNPCPLSRWCHPAISSSVVPSSSLPQSFPASGSFPISQLFAWGGQSIGVSASASVLPMNTQDWFPSGWTGWISLQSKALSRVFSNTTVQKHQFFGHGVAKSQGTEQVTLSLSFTLIKKKKKKVFTFPIMARTPSMLCQPPASS